MENIFSRIIKVSIYLLVFLLPLFWLPFSFEVFEFNKQYLLFFLVSLGFWAWLAKMIISDKEIRWRRTPLDLPVLIFLGVAIFSAIFSVDKTSSLFGFYGRFSDGLIGLLSLGALFFLITNNVRYREIRSLQEIESQKRKIKVTVQGKSRDSERHSEVGPPTVGVTISGVIKTFFWSVFFVILLTYLSIFGAFQTIFRNIGGGWQILAQRSFNPVAGSMEGLAVFLSVVMVFLVGMILKGGQKSKFRNFSLWILLLASFGLLVIFNILTAWWILALGLAALTGFSIAKRVFRANVNKLLLPIFLIVVAVAFLAFPPTRNIQLVQYPVELRLAQGVSWRIAGGSATDSWKNGFLGSGIGTYSYDFAKFKSARFNQSLFWQIRFDRPTNHFAEIFGTMGFLGLLSYLFLLWTFGKNSWNRLREKLKKKETVIGSLALLFSLAALVFGQWFYYQNTVLAFSFWALLGLASVSLFSQADRGPSSVKSFSFKDFPELSLVFSVILIGLGLAIAGMYYWAGRIYLADVYSRAAQREARVENLERAVFFNPYQGQYKILLARAYLIEVNREVVKPAAEQDSVRIQLMTAKAIDQARRATEGAPHWVASWETLGMVYRDIQLWAKGAIEWGIKSFEKALEFEPQNPVFHTELGKLYLLSGDNDKARQEFEKAISLKEDYIEAQIQIVFLIETQENLKGAVRKMEELAERWPLSSEVLFQLGRLYFNDDRLDEAITQFQRVIALVSNHSNAHYSLGLAYQRKGQTNLAISEFEKVLELNPGNQDVEAKLRELIRSKE